MTHNRRWTRALLPAISLAAVLSSALYWGAAHFQPLITSGIPTTHEAALRELHAGNSRFVNSARTCSSDTSHDAEIRRQTAKQQHPFAAILCCSDSRVCPEFIFDQRAGRIFEIRNAGNVVDEDVFASVEYAVEHLHVPLILVLGHKGCGAIEAVCEAGETPLHAHLIELQKHMGAVHEEIVSSHDKCTPETLNRLSRENTREQALKLLHDSPVLKTTVEEGHAKLMCGLYDIETGTVEFFNPE